MRLLETISLVYFGSVLVFGLVYLAVSGRIENGIPGCLVGAYNPNIQPRSIIGYGTPATGLLLVKFVWPTVWLLFIQVAVVKKWAISGCRCFA